MHQEVFWPKEKDVLYPLLEQQLAALVAGCPPISALANAAALLWEALDEINWAGFYLCKGDTLYLGPFQGKTACTLIPIGRQPQRSRGDRRLRRPLPVGERLAH